MESFLEDVSWMKDLMPDDLSIDPERPMIEESIYEVIARDRNSIFAKGLLLLNQLALQQTAGWRRRLVRNRAPSPERTVRPGSTARKAPAERLWLYRWYVIAAVASRSSALFCSSSIPRMLIPSRDDCNNSRIAARWYQLHSVISALPRII